MIMNEWISVHDRSPEIGVRVLVFEKNTVNENMVSTNAENVEVCRRAFMCASGWVDDAGFALDDRPYNVEITHWTPLPCAPGKE